MENDRLDAIQLERCIDHLKSLRRTAQEASKNCRTQRAAYGYQSQAEAYAQAIRVIENHRDRKTTIYLGETLLAKGQT